MVGAPERLVPDGRLEDPKDDRDRQEEAEGGHAPLRNGLLRRSVRPNPEGAMAWSSGASLHRTETKLLVSTPAPERTRSLFVIGRLATVRVKSTVSAGPTVAAAIPAHATTATTRAGSTLIARPERRPSRSPPPRRGRGGPSKRRDGGGLRRARPAACPPAARPDPGPRPDGRARRRPVPVHSPPRAA